MQRSWGKSELVMSQEQKDSQGGWNTESQVECGKTGGRGEQSPSCGAVRTTRDFRLILGAKGATGFEVEAGCAVFQDYGVVEFLDNKPILELNFHLGSLLIQEKNDPQDEMSGTNVWAILRHFSNWGDSFRGGVAGPWSP